VVTVSALVRAVVVVALVATGVAMLLLRTAAPAAVPPAAGVVLSPAQIARHAHEAGFRGDGLVTAVAVALAESRGDTRAHNGVAPDDSWGLWQINMRGPLGPDRRHQFGLASNRDLFNPGLNARVAHALSQGGRDWTPWSTYLHGSHQRFLDRARQGVKAAGELR
jgi:Lysozyme like domain